MDDIPLEDDDEDEENKELRALLAIQVRFPFDLSIDRFLKYTVSQLATFKIRVYLLTCQNLSAVDSKIDLKARLAGLTALCSANPFPVIIVGDGRNDTQAQKIKFISDRDKEIQSDLNPKFFRSYEFDATFPEDWRLEIQIYDKGAI